MTKHDKILNWFKTNAAGLTNAKPLSHIIFELCVVMEEPMSTHSFQRKYLPHFRTTEIFIGQCHKGLFLVMTKEDAEASAMWYQKRIAAETAQMNKLFHIASTFSVPLPLAA